MMQNNIAYQRPTPAWVIIGLLTSVLILVLQTVLFAKNEEYSSAIVSITYTAAILITCSVSLTGHLLVRSYPSLGRFLNVDIDLASVMTGAWADGARTTQGRRRASVGNWLADAEAGIPNPPPPYDIMAEGPGEEAEVPPVISRSARTSASDWTVGPDPEDTTHRATSP